MYVCALGYSDDQFSSTGNAVTITRLYRVMVAPVIMLQVTPVPLKGRIIPQEQKGLLVLIYNTVASDLQCKCAEPEGIRAQI